MEKYNIGFPDDFAHPTEKEQDKWGLQAAKAIWDYANYYSGWSPADRNDRFDKNERLAQGLQGQKQYKPIFGDKDGNVNFMFMFWKETSPLPRYIRSTIKSLIENRFKPKATSLDATSKTEKDKQWNKMKGNVILKKAQDTVFKGTGINVVPPGEYIASSIQEVELRKELDYKIALEIAQEITTQCVLDNNNFEKQRKKSAQELTTKSWACVETWYDDNGDIRFEAFSPFDLLVPYCEDEYFENRKWTARIKRITISELRKINEKYGSNYSDEDLFNIARSAQGRYNNPQWQNDYSYYNRNQRWNSFLVEVMCYEISTVNKYSWVSKMKDGQVKYFNAAKPNSKPKASANKELTQKERMVWYDGMWIVGEDKKLIYHKMRSNMVFQGNNFYDNTPKSRFVIVAPELYHMRNKAIPESAEPYVDRMHTAMLKFQQLLNEIKPPEQAIDINALKGVMEGLGIKNGKPMDIFVISKQIGKLFYNGKNTVSGQHQNQNPVREIPTDIRNQMLAIQEAYNTNLMALENELGINDAMVGMPRNKYEGLGARQQKAAQGLKALSHLQDAQNYLWDEVVNVISQMAQDTLVRGEGEVIKGWSNAIGKANVDLIKLQKDMTLAEFGMKLEMMPTDEDMERLNIEIERSLQQQTIRIEDAQMVREMAKSNIKTAYMFMNFKRKEYLEEQMQKAQADSQNNAQVQQQSAMIAFETEKQLQLLKSQIEKEKEEWKAVLEERNQQAEHLDKLDEIDREGEWKIKHIQEANVNNLDDTESPNNTMKQPPVYTGS